MTDGPNIVVGAVLVDSIVYADGSRRDDVLGGAGLYALAGAALFSDDAVLVTGTGRDLPFGPWLDRNGLTIRGLRFADDHTPRNILRYLDERTRTETPVYGAEHFKKIEPTAGDIAKVLDGAHSLFVFRNLDPHFWDGVLPLIAEHRPMTLWEIALDACLPQNRVRIEELARAVHALSINLEEAALIYETRDEPALVAHLAAIGTPVVFLRAGARGCYAIADGTAMFVPSFAFDPVDVTGGGNAFGGGALIGLANARSPLECAAMGTVAARFAISQFGPPEAGDARLKAEARKLVADLMTTLEQTA